MTDHQRRTQLLTLILQPNDSAQLANQVGLLFSSYVGQHGAPMCRSPIGYLAKIQRLHPAEMRT